MSNSLHPDQDRLLSVLIWVHTVCNGYSLTTKVAASKARDCSAGSGSKQKCLYESKKGIIKNPLENNHSITLKNLCLSWHMLCNFAYCFWSAVGIFTNEPFQ